MTDRKFWGIAVNSLLGGGTMINQLLAMRAFVRVVDTSSFSRAANQLELPRSTLSKLVLDLETHLGTKLLNRTTRAVTPTAEGMEYYRHATWLVAEVDVIDSAVQGSKLKLSGSLRVDAPSTFATSLLIPALVEFHQEHPDITIALGISDRAINIVGEGVDCVIRAGTLEDMAMVGRELTELEYITCASPTYLKHCSIPKHPQDLENGHTLLGYFIAATGKPLPQVFEKGDERYEMSGKAVTVNDGNGLLAMILAGLGVGQHFRRCLQPYIDAGELVPVLPEWTRPGMPFHVIYPANRHQPVRLKVFIDWLLTRFRERPVRQEWP